MPQISNSSWSFVHILVMSSILMLLFLDNFNTLFIFDLSIKNLNLNTFSFYSLII